MIIECLSYDHIKEQLWIMAKTQDFHLCHQYLTRYIEGIRKQMNENQMKLTLQSESCPITTISLEQIDQYLKEFVDCQQKYRSTRNHNHLNKFTDNIMENELFEIITSHYPTINNVSINNCS